MADIVPIDDDYCANCSCSLKQIKSCYKIYKIDVLVHLPKENDAYVSCEQISVIKALRDLFNFELYESCYNSDTCGAGARSKDVPVCLTCSLILQELYKSYALFKNVRRATSYVSQVSEKIQQIFKPEDDEDKQGVHLKNFTHERDPLSEAVMKPPIQNYPHPASETIGGNFQEAGSFPTLTIFKTDNARSTARDVELENDSTQQDEVLEDVSLHNVTSEELEYVQEDGYSDADFDIDENQSDSDNRLSFPGPGPSSVPVAVDKDMIVGIDAKSKKRTITSRKGKICWVVKKTFTDEESARKFILPDWRVNHTFNKSETQKQISYYCAKHKAFRCNAKAKLFYDIPSPGSSKSLEIKFTEAAGFPHTVGNSLSTKRHTEAGLTKQQKDLIRQLIGEGYTDSAEIIGIVEEVVECPEPQPKKGTLQSYIRRHKIRTANQQLAKASQSKKNNSTSSTKKLVGAQSVDPVNQNVQQNYNNSRNSSTSDNSTSSTSNSKPKPPEPSRTRRIADNSVDEELIIP